MASKYPSFSPYTYCANNPVKLVDPNGEEIDWVEKIDGTISWDWNAVSPETTKQGETYLGKEGQQIIGTDVWNFHSDGTTDEQRPIIISGHNNCDDKFSDNTSTQTHKARLSDIFFGTALETTMVGEACKSAVSSSTPASEAKIGQAFKFVSKTTGYLGKFAGGIGVAYTIYQARIDNKITFGEGMRIGIQTTSLVTSFVPGCGPAISLGLTTIDFFFGDKIEKIGLNY